MRIWGKRKLPAVGLRGPTEDEVRASEEHAKLPFIRVPKGVYRYRNHAEANAEMDRWIAEAMAEKAEELDSKLLWSSLRLRR